MDESQANGAANGAATGAGGGDGAAAGASNGFDWGDPSVWLDYAANAVVALVLFVLAWIIASIAARMVERAAEKAKVERTLARFFGNLAKYAIVTLAILAILGFFGVDTTAFAAVFGAITLAIGFALQGSLGNVAAGVMLLIFRPFKIGDYVKAAGEAGTVYEIGLFSTLLDTPDNRRIIIPNGSIFGGTIENITFHETRRCDVSVGTDYPADLDRAREVLLEAARSVENILEDPEPAVMLLELGDSSINWSVRVWVKASDFWPVRDALTRAVKQHLDRAEIGIPFPQMDVHVDGAVGSAA